MKSLIPWNNITKEFSKEFRFSYEKHYDNNLDEINVLNISGGVGLSHKIHNDVLVYNLAKIGTGVNFEQGYPYTSFETGIIIYEILNMKTKKNILLNTVVTVSRDISLPDRLTKMKL